MLLFKSAFLGFLGLRENLFQPKIFYLYSYQLSNVSKRTSLPQPALHSHLPRISIGNTDHFWPSQTDRALSNAKIKTPLGAPNPPLSRCLQSPALLPWEPRVHSPAPEAAPDSALTGVGWGKRGGGTQGDSRPQ